MDDRNAQLSLVFRVQARLCALPLSCAVEIMRPLPIEAVVGAPGFVRGLALIRGVPLPVVDTAQLLGVPEAPWSRFVVVDTGSRRVVLAVGDVLGVRALPGETLRALPPLLSEADADAVEAIGRLDAELLLMLGNARIHVGASADASIAEVG